MTFNHGIKPGTCCSRHFRPHCVHLTTHLTLWFTETNKQKQTMFRGGFRLECWQSALEAVHVGADVQDKGWRDKG